MKELLAAVHEYVADFFHKNRVENVCSRQFEETALLALGISLDIREVDLREESLLRS